MPNFAELLDKTKAEVKRPASLPTATYKGRIKRFEFGESREKKTPYVRLSGVYSGEWPDDLPESARVSEKGDAIDLEGKTWRIDYYLTNDALYRLTDLMEALGVLEEGATIREALPNLVEAEVLVDTVAEIDQRGSGETFNRVNRLGTPN